MVIADLSSTAISAGSKEAPSFTPATPTPEPRVLFPAIPDTTSWTTVDAGEFYYPGHRYPRFVEIPPKLIDATGDLGIQRKEFTENRVANLISPQPGVRSVTISEHDSDYDKDGYDLTVEFESGFKVFVQVKSSGAEVSAWKQYLRDKYFPGDTDLIRVSEFLTKNNIIIVNGGETKKNSEIIFDSIIPQLELIRQKEIRSQPKIDIGRLAFSGTAKPDDVEKWLAQNP